MVHDGADQKDGDMDIAEDDVAAVNLVAALEQIIVQKQPAQVLAVHSKGHSRCIGVPGHEVVQRTARAEEIILDDPGPE